jgi:hypothetical protein
MKCEYKIYNKETDKYISSGYVGKASWKRFPKEQINKLDDKHEIHKFEYVMTKLTKLNKKGEIIDVETQSS